MRLTLKELRKRANGHPLGSAAMQAASVRGELLADHCEACGEELTSEGINRRGSKNINQCADCCGEK